MEVIVNGTSIENCFGENTLLKPIGKCVKYYVGGVMYFSTYCAILGGIIGGLVGAAFCTNVVLVLPVMVVGRLIFGGARGGSTTCYGVTN